VAGDETKREALEGLYLGLSPKERRERLFVSPAYRSAYNRALDSEDRMTLPRYFWRKWLPLLGAKAAALYVVLRDIARVEAKGSDSWCWPEQSELGLRIGVSEYTLRKLLAVLERHGFIMRERRREPRSGAWQMVQGTNHYNVYLDIPLTPHDAVELLLNEVRDHAGAADFGGDTACTIPVDNTLGAVSAPRGSDRRSCGQSIEEVRPLSSSDLRNCAPNVNNVDNLSNVRKIPSGKRPLREHPSVMQLSGTERRERARLAVEIGDTLQRMSGERDGGPHSSLGFHRRVAFLMPAHLVHEALRATRDGVDDRRAGRGGVRQDPSKYFGGIVKQLAQKHGIDLGLKTSPPRQAPAGKPTSEALPSAAEPGPAPEERARVRELLRDLQRRFEP
jgi:hypothetical protein